MPSHAVAKKIDAPRLANSTSFGIFVAAMKRQHPGLWPKARRSGRLNRLPWLAAISPSVVLSLVITIGSLDAADAAGRYYTEAQAQAGQTLFQAQCAICHGDSLQGKVGPALAGQQFLSVSQYQQLNADYLYQFMSKHMPQNAPGSLSQTQYLDALAYILKVNGYPSGTQPLTADDKLLARIKIEPTGTSQQSQR